MTPPEIKLGDTLYSLKVNNAARNQAQKLTPVTVVKIGRKYFDCLPHGKDCARTTYHLDTWRQKTNYSADSVLYRSEREWLEENEADQIRQKISEVFRFGNNTKVNLAGLREIQSIIDGNTRTPDLDKVREALEACSADCWCGGGHRNP